MAHASSIQLSPYEWDFSTVPKDEREFAVIYEYAREHPQVQRSISNWLASPQKQYCCEGHDPFETGVKVIEDLRDELRGRCFLSNEDDYVDPPISRHRIFDIRELLSYWPDPFTKVRNERLFQKGLAIVKKKPAFASKFHRCLFSVGRIRSSNRKQGFEKTRAFPMVNYPSNRWGLPTFAFDIDFRFAPEKAAEEFQEWYNVEQTKWAEIQLLQWFKQPTNETNLPISTSWLDEKIAKLRELGFTTWYDECDRELVEVGFKTWLSQGCLAQNSVRIEAALLGRFGEGRKRGNLAKASLKKLAALRLWRSVPNGSSEGKYNQILDVLRKHKSEKKIEDSDLILPDYTSNSGFTTAWKDAEKLIQEYNEVRVYDDRTGSWSRRPWPE